MPMILLLFMIEHIDRVHTRTRTHPCFVALHQNVGHIWPCRDQRRCWRGVGPGQNGHYHKHTIIDCKAGPPFPGHVNLPGTCADSPRCSAAEVDGLNCIWTRARVCVCLCDGSVFHCLTFGLIIKRFNWKYTGRVGAPPCLETTENGDNYTASNMRRCNLCPSIVQTVYYSWPYAI